MTDGADLANGSNYISPDLPLTPWLPSGSDDLPHPRGIASQWRDPWAVDMDHGGVMGFSPASSAPFEPYGSYPWESLEISSPPTSSQISTMVSSGPSVSPISELVMGWDFGGLDVTTQYFSYADADTSQPSHRTITHLHGVNEGTVDQGAGTNAAIKRPARTRGRPRIYTEDGTRRAGEGSQKQLQQHTSTRRAGKGAQNSPFLGSDTSAGAAASNTSRLGKASSRETPIAYPGIAKDIRARNKAAAVRYRAKMQAGIEKAELEEHEAEFRHSGLVARASQLREEVLQLKNELLAQASCGCPLIQGYLSNAACNLYASGWGRSPTTLSTTTS